MNSLAFMVQQLSKVPPPKERKPHLVDKAKLQEKQDQVIKEMLQGHKGEVILNDILKVTYWSRKRVRTYLDRACELGLAKYLGHVVIDKRHTNKWIIF